MSDELIQREIEALEAQLRVGNLSHFGRAKIAGRLLWLRSLPPPEIQAFAQKLKARQGTTMPDFDSLYKRKARIDRRFGEFP